ncbi:MAG: sulfotransferase domain-containing protein [Magnetospiraceae bacterium]
MAKFLIIIGSAKCGTTSLAHWLNQREDMLLGPIKEPRFFTDFGKRNWTGPGSDIFSETIISSDNAYFANFNGADEETWCIDASTDYIWQPQSAKRIADFSKEHEVKLVAIVRDPVERAVSEYNHTLRNRDEVLSFEDSLLNEEKRMEKGWQPLFYHKRRSTVSKDLENYKNIFGDYILILDFSLTKHPQNMIDEVTNFLQLPRCDVDAERIFNQTYLPRNMISSRIMDLKIDQRIENLIPNEGLKKTFRWYCRRTLTVNSREKRTVSQREREIFTRSISEEISRCIECDFIPTENWKVPSFV